LIKPLEEHSSLVIAYRHNNKVLSDKPFVAVLWVSQASGKKSTLDAFYSKRLAEADRTTRRNSSCAWLQRHQTCDRWQFENIFH